MPHRNEPSTDPELLRMASALAHVVPGVSLMLGCRDGRELTVAHGRLDAALDPCELRRAVVVAHRQGGPRLSAAVTDISVRGVEDLGGGLYRRQGPSGEERWFATTLEARAVAEEFDRFPVDLPDGAMTVSLKPDAGLGVTVVRVVTAEPAFAHRLDEVGLRCLAMCMVAEVVASALPAARTPRPRR